MIESSLPEPHVWPRLTQPHHHDAFDMPYAREIGGRWNPPRSWLALYLNDDMATVHAQVRHLFAGRGIDPDDLDDSAPIELAAATLPQRQRVADVVSDSGVASVGLRRIPSTTSVSSSTMPSRSRRARPRRWAGQRDPALIP